MSIRGGRDEEEGVWSIEEERMWPTEKPENQRISAMWARTPEHEPASGVLQVKERLKANLAEKVEC